jgi:hypothetical protein
MAAAGAGVRKRGIAIGSEYFPGAKRFGLRHNHRSLSVGKFPDKFGKTQAARAIWPKYGPMPSSCQACVGVYVLVRASLLTPNRFL